MIENLQMTGTAKTGTQWVCEEVNLTESFNRHATQSIANDEPLNFIQCPRVDLLSYETHSPVFWSICAVTSCTELASGLVKSMLEDTLRTRQYASPTLPSRTCLVSGRILPHSWCLSICDHCPRSTIADVPLRVDDAPRIVCLSHSFWVKICHQFWLLSTPKKYMLPSQSIYLPDLPCRRSSMAIITPCRLAAFWSFIRDMRLVLIKNAWMMYEEYVIREPL